MEASQLPSRSLAPLLGENQENQGKSLRQRWLESAQMEHHPDHDPAPHKGAKTSKGLEVG